jgi:hypothetical protein
MKGIGKYVKKATKALGVDKDKIKVLPFPLRGNQHSYVVELSDIIKGLNLKYNPVNK